MEEQCQFVFETAELWCFWWQVELSHRYAQAPELPFRNRQRCWYGLVMVDLGVLARLYVLTCASVFIYISFHYLRSITFASYDVCGFPCASKCVVHINGLTRLQWAKVL